MPLGESMSQAPREVLLFGDADVEADEPVFVVDYVHQGVEK